VKVPILISLIFVLLLSILILIPCSADDTQLGGTIQFYSSPSGAKIYVDGVYAGVTPLTLPNVAPGGRDIKITDEGYFDWYGLAGVPSGGVTNVVAYMIPTLFSPIPTSIGPTGMIIVITEPYGGTVYLDGRFKGTAPTTIENVPEGEHVVVVTYPAKPDYTAHVVVKSGTPAQVRVNLDTGEMDAEPTPAPGASSPGTVAVSSSPDKATVFINDEYYGSTPLALTLQKGEYDISLIKKNYNIWEKAVRVIPNKTIYLVANLVRSGEKVVQLPVVTPLKVKNTSNITKVQNISG